MIARRIASLQSYRKRTILSASADKATTLSIDSRCYME
jgi:hypothetical protein